jgi:hypothetical protein
MTFMRPIGMILVGLLLVFAGFAAIFLMVIGVIPTGFILNFAGYGASFVGLMFGIVGLSQYTAGDRGGF